MKGPKNRREWRKKNPRSRTVSQYRALSKETRELFGIDTTDTLLVIDCPEHGMKFASASRSFLRAWPEAHEPILGVDDAREAHPLLCPDCRHLILGSNGIFHYDFGRTVEGDSQTPEDEVGNLLPWRPR